MPTALFEHALLPVADDDDARTTSVAALPHVRDAGGQVTAVNVVEKAGGAPDKASVEQMEERAEDIFDVVRDVFVDAGVPVDTRIAYGTDVAEAIFQVAADVGATAVVFTPRGGSRWIRLLTGDVALNMITENDRPVVALPDRDDGGGGSGLADLDLESTDVEAESEERDEESDSEDDE